MTRQFHPWHAWFTWRPVRTLDERLTWLRRIERRPVHFSFESATSWHTGWYWEYRRHDGYAS